MTGNLLRPVWETLPIERQRALAGMSEKVFRRHRERLAIVYIRQSTVQQVERHQESTRLQCALVNRAFHFGWARETIVVADDDLGRSGASIEDRLDFQRLVAEVGLGRAGLAKALAFLRRGDCLVVWKLDRLGRSLPHLLTTITGLKARGVAFRSLTEQMDTTTPHGEFLFHVFGALAQFERSLIQKRLQAGLAAAARRGPPRPPGWPPRDD